MKRSLLTTALALATGLTSFAQTTPKAPTKLLSGPFPKGERGPAAWFTGAVYVHTLVKNDDTFNCASSNVTFTPGARSHWHKHAAGQILMVTEGVGYYQEKGQPIRLLRQGEVIQAQPGVEHWHGASPQQGMTHISLNVNTEKGIVDWGRPVTDQEYNSFQ
ncbi:(R)-mandelonitrile lyase [Hymenobacter volaticus]|uniref:Cupin domain-containing protein n=1 Tax=Hymenobacter volaticus TaxID=2932254 RepID=A0ABY4GH31_9BACT|nr:cupin domain-containing protein [Hymenobacter volaticus]UOQ69952.1 cupin domain-containing protein [Hymenobacter volaticus]